MDRFKSLHALRWLLLGLVVLGFLSHAAMAGPVEREATGMVGEEAQAAEDGWMGALSRVLTPRSSVSLRAYDDSDDSGEEEEGAMRAIRSSLTPKGAMSYFLLTNAGPIQSASAVSPCGTIRFMLEMFNPDPTNASDAVVFTLPIPDNVVFVTGSVNTNGSLFADSIYQTGDTLVFSWDSIPAQASAVYFFDTEVLCDLRPTGNQQVVWMQGNVTYADSITLTYDASQSGTQPLEIPIADTCMLPTPTLRLELNYRELMRRNLFVGLTTSKVHLISAISRLAQVTSCNLVNFDIPASSGLSQREALASDPNTVRSLYPTHHVPCPVVNDYVELNYATGLASEAIQQWRETDGDLLQAATDYGLGVTGIPGEKFDATFSVILVGISNDESNCPPQDLPDAYDSVK